MVVKSNGGRRGRGQSAGVEPIALDLGYLAFFLGLRVNELVAMRLATEGFGDVLESHGYVIQHLIETERSITELARRMEVTQQAASKAVAELQRLGIVEVGSSGDRRTKSVRLSERGWHSVKMARKFRQQIERRLIRAAGAGRYEEAKRILLKCYEMLGDVERIRLRRIRPPR